MRPSPPPDSVLRASGLRRRTALTLLGGWLGGALAAQPPDRSRLPAFQLVRPSGAPLTQADLGGRWAAVFFGYTTCPDVCPTTMLVLAQVLERLGPQAHRLQGLFVTVDPERDTPAVLQAYTAQFHRNILAATGTPAQVRAAADAFGLKFRLNGEAGTANYTVDHAAVVLLFNPEGRFVSLVPYGATARELLALLARHGVQAP